MIVVGSRNWHPGVVGIVASRLMRKYHRPAFVVAIDEKGMGKGSGRSVEGVSLVEAIAHGREFLTAGGGHHMAAGISVEEDQLGNFRESFAKYVLENASTEDLEPKLHIDGVLGLGDLDLDFCISMSVCSLLARAMRCRCLWRAMFGCRRLRAI